MFVQRGPVCFSVHVEQHSTGQKLQVAQPDRLVFEVEGFVEVDVVFVADAHSWSLPKCVAMRAVEKRHNGIRRVRGERCVPEVQPGGESVATVGGESVVITKLAQTLQCRVQPIECLRDRVASLRCIGVPRWEH